MTTALLHCPFCGATGGALEIVAFGNLPSVKCDCGAAGPIPVEYHGDDRDRAKAVALWNRRAPAPEEPADG